METFYQAGPELGNQYRDDQVLRRFLERTFGVDLLNEIKADLDRMGERAVTDLWALACRAEDEQPRHIPFDPWGRRIDRIETSTAWDALKTVAAEEGLIAAGYERQFGTLSRLYQFSLLYLFHPSSAIFSCPLAMADGAARAIELYGDAALKEGAFQHLISRDPNRFWTSGQWMTERSGGSDVSGTETLAIWEGDHYRLYGTKWFTSATTSEMAMTLARIEGDPAGSRGLSMFYVELGQNGGGLENIIVHRLKDKLGTKALPTAELTLDGCKAKLVGEAGRGVPTIASLFNITRIYNAVCAVGYMRRALAVAKDYAHKRRAFGKLLIDHPLHQKTLAEMEVSFRANFLLVFHLAHLLGKQECGRADASEEALLRLLTPVAKLFSGKHAVALCSEMLESFGGAGYVEDTRLPVILRNAQVLAIWEGTTNVLSLDLLRAMVKERAFEPFPQEIRRRLIMVDTPVLESAKARLESALIVLENHVRKMAESDQGLVETGARVFAFYLGWLFAGTLMLEQAQWELVELEDDTAAIAARWWCAREPEPLITSEMGVADQAGKLAGGT